MSNLAINEDGEAARSAGSPDSAVGQNCEDSLLSDSPLPASKPILNLADFTSCQTVSQLEAAYQARGIVLPTRQQLFDQISIDWKMAIIEHAGNVPSFAVNGMAVARAVSRPKTVVLVSAITPNAEGGCHTKIVGVAHSKIASRKFKIMVRRQLSEAIDDETGSGDSKPQAQIFCEQSLKRWLGRSQLDITDVLDHGVATPEHIVDRIFAQARKHIIYSQDLISILKYGQQISRLKSIESVVRAELNLGNQAPKIAEDNDSSELGEARTHAILSAHKDRHDELCAFLSSSRYGEPYYVTVERVLHHHEAMSFNVAREIWMARKIREANRDAVFLCGQAHAHAVAYFLALSNEQFNVATQRLDSEMGLLSESFLEKHYSARQRAHSVDSKSTSLAFPVFWIARAADGPSFFDIPKVRSFVSDRIKNKIIRACLGIQWKYTPSEVFSKIRFKRPDSLCTIAAANQNSSSDRCFYTSNEFYDEELLVKNERDDLFLNVGVHSTAPDQSIDAITATIIAASARANAAGRDNLMCERSVPRDMEFIEAKAETTFKDPEIRQSFIEYAKKIEDEYKQAQKTRNLCSDIGADQIKFHKLIERQTANGCDSLRLFTILNPSTSVRGLIRTWHDQTSGQVRYASYTWISTKLPDNHLAASEQLNLSNQDRAFMHELLTSFVAL